ncbi:hypothetical protein L6452_37838 [Arctium lappa]|uniref:Uncharacterized protein n=1 Tax=Arctium lappa TaxID=4217 RepID=A0ACB8Y430_ARCLA|nr:hypothetical protein L6452_37838 [Arctium lappa]
MGKAFVLKSPKREEQIVPDSVIAEFFESNGDNLSDFKDILGIKAEGITSATYDELNWDHLMEWDEFSVNEEDEDSGDKSENMVDLIGNVKRGICEIWEDDEDEDENQEDKERNSCLKLSLNYQEVMDAWSNRGPCQTDDFVRSTSNDGYMGEVPVMKEAKTKREASVLRYRKKRQNRLFSRKIRYHIRKLNADKRPRLKGRFVKRES